MAGGRQVLINFLEQPHLLGPTLLALFLLSVHRWSKKKNQRRLWVSMWDWGQAEEADTCLRHVEGRGDVPR